MESEHKISTEDPTQSSDTASQTLHKVFNQLVNDKVAEHKKKWSADVAELIKIKEKNWFDKLVDVKNKWIIVVDVIKKEKDKTIKNGPMG